ncbi:MAG: nucleotide-binding protein [Pseudomonadota bacterium]
MTSPEALRAPVPRVFIGSSTEGLPLAETLQGLLQHDADVRLWTDNVFKLSRAFMEDLEAELDEADFAIMAFTADDVATSRDQSHAIPRDNVLFELGLFMGRLGRERCYFVHDKAHNLKLPSDLLGINPATFRLADDGDLAASLKDVVSHIRERLTTLGGRPKLDDQVLDVFHQKQAFGAAIEGQWWQRMLPDTESALGYVTLKVEPATGNVRMTARAFALDHRPIAQWESKGTALNVSARTVFYYWTGWHPRTPNESFEGFGEMRFRQHGATIDQGNGLYFDTNLSRVDDTERKSFQMRRVSAAEKAIMESGEADPIRALIAQTLGSFL